MDIISEENKLKLLFDITILRSDVNKNANLFHDVEKKIYKERKVEEEKSKFKNKKSI